MITKDEVTPEAIEALIKVEDERLQKEKNQEKQENNLDNKLVSKLRNKQFSDSIRGIRIDIGNAITALFFPEITSIRLQLISHTEDSIKFEELGNKKPYASSYDKKTYYDKGWHVEQSYDLYASDLKRIAESSGKDELRLWLRDEWRNRTWMYPKGLKHVISVIWFVVNNPSEEVYKLQQMSAEITEYSKNVLKAYTNKDVPKAIWIIGILLTIFVGGIWSFIIGKLTPLILFAIGTIAFGALCSMRLHKLKLDIKAFESKYEI